MLSRRCHGFNAAGSVHFSRRVRSITAANPVAKVGKVSNCTGVEAKQASSRAYRPPKSVTRKGGDLFDRRLNYHHIFSRRDGAIKDLISVTIRSQAHQIWKWQPRVSAGPRADPLYQTSLILRALARIMFAIRFAQRFLQIRQAISLQAIASTVLRRPRLPKDSHSIITQ